MKRVVAYVAVGVLGLGLGFSAPATGSPGGLDKKGGHHCWTNCKKYGKYTGQYHCHKKPPCNKKVIKKHRRHGH